MGPVEAIKSGFAKSFDFSGRASRSEYWWFLPIGVLTPASALLLWNSLPGDATNWIGALIVFVTLIPLLAVTTRRLRDTGEPADNVRLPTLQLIGLVMTLLVWRGFHMWAVNGFETADGPGGFGLMIVFSLGSAAFFFVAFRFLVLGLITGTALFSQMAAPPRETKHNCTSNPNEVPS